MKPDRTLFFRFIPFKFPPEFVSRILILAAAFYAVSALATVVSVAGNDTLVGNRPLNLLTNGSFEADGGVAPNLSYWAAGTTLTPTMSLNGWSTSGQVNSYAMWGNNGFGGINNSALFPHGTNGLYFGGGIMASVTPFPIEAPDGLMSFATNPVITPKPTDGPVILQQTVAGLNPAATYVLDFWTSGEGADVPAYTNDGFFGLDITGESRLYFAAPSGSGPIGSAQRYQVYFVPTASTVTFKWINWGHYMDTNGMSDEIVLDDVILNLAANVPLQCGCLTNLQLTCPATLPDLCALATNCFTTNMLPGSCVQNMPPGMPLSVGNYTLNLQVMDMQSNTFACPVTITVNAPSNAPPLMVICTTNKTVECGSNWNFDPPTVTSSCCGLLITPNDTVVSNNPCSQTITRTWDIIDGCGNMTNCSQQVTLVDTTPPGTQCNGQNLVLNGDFERYTNCPSSISQADFAAPWFTPTDATPDYYNSCSPVGSSVTTPTNGVGVQVPLSGNAYMGAHLYTKFGTDITNSYREYLEVPLVTSLTAGQTYLVSFYVSRAEYYGQAVANISARLLPLAYTQYGPPSNLYGGVLNFPTPAQVANPTNNVITDSTNWTLIQGTYTAIGGENHILLGNFTDDPGSAATFVGGQNTNYAYYYFDDVSVVAVCDAEMTNKVVQCGQPWEIPPFPYYDNCNGGSVTVSNYTSTNSLCPKVVQRDWFLEDACGFTNSFTQTVTIVDTNPPLLLCAAGANLAPNPQFENYAPCPNSISQLPDAGPWFNPTVATPDYYNACTTFWPVSTPANLVGSQTPLSGQGYVGLYAYTRYNTNPPGGYREYIEAPLLTPLQPGLMYQVSFRVSLADLSAYAVADLGAYLSAGPLINGATDGVLIATPQIFNPTNNVLNSTNAWTLITGTYTAVGGEDHITIGNFKTDANTTFATHWGANSPLPDLRQAAYYYVEDVEVVPLCAFTNKTVVCGEPWTLDTPLAYDECAGDSLNTAILSTTTNNTSCPLSVTRVWLISDPCGNFLTATQTVTILDNTPPVAFSCTPTNLVPNCQFESYTSCPGGLDLLGLAAPWYLPTPGTADYFNTCASPSSGVLVPTNWIGNQMTYSGQGYAGLYAYALPNSYREYLQVPLLAPLVTNQTYTVSFRVSLADNSGWAVAELGAHFSVGQLLSGNDTPLNVVPQVVNPSANLLTSSNSWMLVQGTFTAAGGETHLTLGNFLSNAVTTITPAGGYEASIGYYYIDDVRVIPPCSPGAIVPVKNIACGATWEFDTVFAEDACAGTNITTTINTVTNSLCPFQATRTWTFTDSCTNTTTVSQTVIATNNASLVVNCDCLMDALSNQLTTNNTCNAVVPLIIIPTNTPCISNTCGLLVVTQTPPAGTPVGVGSHNLTLQISNCGGSTNTCIVPFQVNSPSPTITCPPDIIVPGCSNNSAIVYFAATATGHVGVITYSPPSGSMFALGTNLVTATATNSCGGIAVCTFRVIVRTPHPKFHCFRKAIGIITYPPPTGRIIHLPDFPNGGKGVDFAYFSGTEGIRFEFGPAEKFTFSTVLDFSAPTNAGFELRLPPGGGSTTGTPLVRFERGCETSCGWFVRLAPEIVSDPGARFRAVAISEAGELFDSVLVDRAALDTNAFAFIGPTNGSQSALLTVTFDLRTRELTLGLPGCEWTSRGGGKKGWDGCIFSVDDRPPGTNKAARIIITPPLAPPLPPITELALTADNLATLAFDNPSLTMSGRKWSDGHVTLMKAYDDGVKSGMEFFAEAAGGGVTATLGHAAGFSFHMTSLDTNGLPLLEQQVAICGWPTGMTPNRPVINLRLAPNLNDGGVDVGASFADWGVSEVTVQLWNGTLLVSETNHVPATSGGTLFTLAGFPDVLGCPGIGVVSLSDTNPIFVTGGLVCGSLGCQGTEVRIIAEPTPMFTPPTAYSGLSVSTGEDMDFLLHQLQIAPACAPGARQFTINTNAVDVDWGGEGFRLQCAESVFGPWYDLDVETPATIPANAPRRVFRLRCD